MQATNNHFDGFALFLKPQIQSTYQRITMFGDYGWHVHQRTQAAVTLLAYMGFSVYRPAGTSLLRRQAKKHHNLHDALKTGKTSGVQKDGLGADRPNARNALQHFTLLFQVGMLTDMLRNFRSISSLQGSAKTAQL